ncbi:MAG: DUF1211 domain-containing protein [Bacteroidetes bacterium]|nr:DUF1211 domain-containing protein [Bacteroidota bacterium]
MNKNRLEAFSDGVLAIIITIMVLEIKTPHGSSWQDIKPLLPIVFSYLFSFIYVGIYWNNHHHLFHIVKGINGKVLWGNLHLLFWLSLLPFATAWMDENNFESLPVAFYGFILFMCGTSWKILTTIMIKFEGENSKLKQAYRNDTKSTISIAFYILGIISAFFYPIISLILYISVACIWFIPDKRIEKQIKM